MCHGRAWRGHPRLCSCTQQSRGWPAFAGHDTDESASGDWYHTRRTFQKYGPVAEITPVRLLRYAVRIWNVPNGMHGTMSNARLWISSTVASRSCAVDASTKRRVSTSIVSWPR